MTVTYRPHRRRDELLMHQVHAAHHVLARRGGPACPGAFPQLKAITRFICPCCGQVVDADQASEDHAPIQAGTFTMGPATTTVLTCAPCNNLPGRSYEAAAGHNDKAPELDLDLPGMNSAVYGRRRVQTHRTLRLFLVREETPFVRTDFKAGFLLAFAALGYEWALSPGARLIAPSLHPDAPEPAPAHAYLMRSTIDSPLQGENVVMEVADPQACVIVRAATGLSVVLPAAGRTSVPTVQGDLRARFYPWPSTGSPGSTGGHVDREHRAGHLFHLDFCDAPDHVG
ncbi:hypothetical protein [Asanoa iriomotensis]|uniref:hypothetical protein n=1 Tax=Asanoa iriomotensis TaxID=234613 RepID=UPI001942DDE8|nr:hypothetical protein [Asanoa iriomotensis]